MNLLKQRLRICFMKIEIIKHSSGESVSEEFLKKNTAFLIEKLIEKKILTQKAGKLVLVFVSLKDIQSLNLRYLKKNRPTDILSFAPVEKDSLGELILCEEQIRFQAKEQTFEEEMIYLILHGLLHLLGYHHEAGGRQAQKMYQLQDSLFDLWLQEKKKTEL